MSAAGLITDRAVIRSSAPDILLTNYKMLDQLLLRHADAKIWRDSAHSLQYLVLDEFHTYDGAQGTDVSMLLRRLGLALKSHWSDDDPAITEDDRTRPLGRITPVATSATLGDRGDPVAMLDFAHTVFGEEFGDDAVVTESRLSLDEWIAPSTEVVAASRLERAGRRAGRPCRGRRDRAAPRGRGRGRADRDRRSASCSRPRGSGLSATPRAAAPLPRPPAHPPPGRGRRRRRTPARPGRYRGRRRAARARDGGGRSCSRSWPR